MSIHLIAAVGNNLELGQDNRLLWRQRADLVYFKRQTFGQQILMGRNTFDSLSGLLENRDHLVLTSSDDLPDTVGRVDNLYALTRYYQGCDEVLWVVGGGDVYRQLLPIADALYLTRILADFPQADTYFPKFDLALYDKLVLAHGKADLDNQFDYQMELYTRKDILK